MATLFDYLLWRGDLSFRASPFNEVDNLILAELSFVDFAEILPSDPSASMTLRDAAEIYFSAERETQSALLVPEAVPLLRAAAETERFSSLYLCGFERRTDAQCEAQFAAITFLLPDGEMFIAFRGTDDSLVGWKEDFNMAFLSVIPSQSSAMLYVDRMAATYPAYRIRIGGHSKGGNLAVYSAAKCASVHRERIIRVYNNDGPGFSRAFLDSEGYTAIKDRIHTILPETSVVGMLLVSGVFSQEGTGDFRGILLGLGAALLYASVVLINKKITNISAYDKTVVQLAAAAAVMVPYLLLTEDFAAMSLTPLAGVLLLVMGIVHTGAAYALYFGSFDKLSAQTVAVFGYLDPVAAVILSALILRESMDAPQIFGAVLILAAAVAGDITWKKKK
jgi:uncharacterized membrane protein